MLELAATIVITVTSVLLFGYWFRYTCVLILSARTTRDYAGEVAAANQLQFPEVQSVLQQSGLADLERLKASLDRDYKVLTYLLKHAASTSTAEGVIEKRMLRVHYGLMRSWYRVTSMFAPSAARNALQEMAAVVAHFANTMGAQAAGATA